MTTPTELNVVGENHRLNKWYTKPTTFVKKQDIQLAAKQAALLMYGVKTALMSEPQLTKLFRSKDNLGYGSASGKATNKGSDFLNRWSSPAGVMVGDGSVERTSAPRLW